MNNPINTFKRYITVTNTNKTINIASTGFLSNDQLDNAPLSPNNKLMKNHLVKFKYQNQIEEMMNYTCKK